MMGGLCKWYGTRGPLSFFSISSKQTTVFSYTNSYISHNIIPGKYIIHDGCTVVMAQRLTRSGASGDRRNPLGTPIPPPIISDLPSKFFLLPPKSLRIFSSLHLTPLLRRNLASRPPFLHFKPTSLEELLLPIPVWQKSLSCDWIPSSSHLQDPK
jgi:hypothetical protein